MSLSIETTTPGPSDAPSQFPSGAVSYYNVDTDDRTPDWPDPGVLEVIRGNGTSGCTQYLHSFGHLHVRHTTGSTWGAWVQQF